MIPRLGVELDGGEAQLLEAATVGQAGQVEGERSGADVTRAKGDGHPPIGFLGGQPACQCEGKFERLVWWGRGSDHGISNRCQILTNP